MTGRAPRARPTHASDDSHHRRRESYPPAGTDTLIAIGEAEQRLEALAVALTEALISGDPPLTDAALAAIRLADVALLHLKAARLAVAGMTVYEPGQLLGVDETAEPRIAWLAYSDAGQLWAACYLNGSPLREGPDGWYRHDAKSRKVAVNDKTLDRARACLPGELPVWPPQEELCTLPQEHLGTVSQLAGMARLTHQRASSVKVVPPVWRWRYWLVAGAVQLLVGRQGTGKSTFASWVIAQLSTGRPWPDDGDHRDPLPCGMLSLEEPAERLAARLTAIGADLDTVEILGHVEDYDDDGRPYRRPWRLPADCGALEVTIGALGLAVVTIDGLGYSVSGDSHNYANVGSALSALAGVAERSGCAIVGLTHPPKGNSDAVTAAIGSTAWTAVSRITWVMGLDPTDELPDTHRDKRRVVRPAPGSNYRLPGHGLSFTIGDHDETEAGFVTNLKSSDIDAQAITSPPIPGGSEQADSVDACSVLTEILTPEPVWVKDAIEQMAAAGFTKDQARRAKDKIARAIKVGSPTANEHGWKWEFRVKGGEDGKGGASPNGATFASFGPSLPSSEREGSEGGALPERTPLAPLEVEPLPWDHPDDRNEEPS